MTPEEIEARRAEAEAWENTIADHARDYVQHVARHGTPPIFVFFGYGRDRDRFCRDLCRALDPLPGPLFLGRRRMNVIRPHYERLRGTRARLIAVYQSYPWRPSPQEAREADEAERLIGELNRSNGWTSDREEPRV